MDKYDEVLAGSAIQGLDIESYWPSGKETEGIEDNECATFLLFYQSLLDHFMLDETIRPSHVKYALTKLIKSYGLFQFSDEFPEPDYDNLPNSLGYLQIHAACNAAIVYDAMHRIFHSNPPGIIKRMLTVNDQLGIVCLGSGPGNDLLGLLSALYGKHYGLLKLDITAVDKMLGWNDIFSEAQRRLRDDDWGNASKLLEEVDVTDSFEPTDLVLPLTWTDDFKQKISSANIVTMAHVLSVVSDVQKSHILEHIVDLMKFGSVLIFIDRIYPSDVFDAFQDYLELVYDATIEKFRYDYEVERFGFNSTTMSSAHIRVFERNVQ